MGYYEVTTYNVGQGLFNLLRIKNAEPTVYEWAFCGVLDCGSSSNPDNAKRSINDAVKKIREVKRLDILVISHQDKDHWSYVEDFIIKLFNLEEDTWYKSDKTQHLVKYRKKGNVSILEKYWEKADCQTQAGECRYTCNYINGDAMVKLTRIARGNELSWLVEGGISGSCSKYFNIYGKFKGDNIVYTRIWRPGTIPGPFEEHLSQNIYEEIRACIKKHAKHFGFSDDHVPKIGEMITEAFRRSITFSTENEKVLNGFIGEVYLGGAGGDENRYNLLKDYLDEYALAVMRIKEPVLLGMQYLGSTKQGFDFDPNVSENSHQSTTIKSILYNATSLISYYVLDDGRLLLFPGDATMHTFGSVQQFLHGLGCSVIEFITAPHHGSLETNFVLDDCGDVASCHQPIVNFFNTFTPQVVSVSAYHGTYGHPNLKTVGCMCLNARACDSHTVVACTKIWLINWGHRYNCETALYTTEGRGDVIIEDGKAKKKQVKKYKITRHLPSDDMFVRRM